MKGSRVVSYVNMLNPYNQLQLETPSVRFVCIGSDPPSSDIQLQLLFSHFPHMSGVSSKSQLPLNPNPDY
jgi:hypothetical protein